jgi:hypothetical protein
MAWNKLSAYATTISSDSSYTRVIYQSTDIVKWNQDRITLNSGGWETRTTKRKMNQAARQFKLEYSVFQDDFTWYVTFNNKTVPYKDGIILDRVTKDIYSPE